MRLAVQQLLGGAAVEEQRPRVRDPVGEERSVLLGEFRRERQPSVRVRGRAFS